MTGTALNDCLQNLVNCLFTNGKHQGILPVRFEPANSSANSCKGLAKGLFYTKKYNQTQTC